MVHSRRSLAGYDHYNVIKRFANINLNDLLATEHEFTHWSIISSCRIVTIIIFFENNIKIYHIVVFIYSL